MYTDIVCLLEHQDIEHEATVAQQLSRFPHKLNKPIFGRLIRKITTYALYKLENELACSRRLDFPLICDGLFTQSMRLPCGHVMKQRATTGRPIELQEIHRHWYFKPLEAPALAYETIVMELLLQNPMPARTQGQPRGRGLSTQDQNQPEGTSSRGRGRSITSTQREPSDFELAV